MYERPLLVVKIGGSLIPPCGELQDTEQLRGIAKDIAGLYPRNDFVILHGGGNRVTYRMKEMGKEPQFITSRNGMRSRYTDRGTMDIFADVMGDINQELVDLLTTQGLSSRGFYNGSSPLMGRRKKALRDYRDGKVLLVRDDYSGRLYGLDRNCLLDSLEREEMPVISPVAVGEEEEFLNVDGDTAAAYTASELGARTLILITDVTGVLDGDNELVRRVPYQDLDSWISRVDGGMKRKLMASKEAIERGLEKVLICGGREDRPLSRALRYENGTVIKGDN